LRYGDGRPDIPIQPAEPIRSRSRRREDSSTTSPITPHNPNYRQRSGSHGSSPLARSHHTSSRSERSPPVPEEIRVLPSRPDRGPQPSSSSHKPRSKSLPRTADLHSRAEAFAPPLPPLAVPQIPPHAPAPGSHPPAWHPYPGRPPKQPPSIVYAPSHQSRTHYAPPAMLHHPPQMGPNGMIYSHSAPVNQAQFARNMSSVPYPHNTVRPSRREDVWAERGRNGVMPSARQRARSSSSSSLSSDESGGTYYVLPHHGQKVHIITPSPERSVGTATSTTRSPASTIYKKPFLQRLFSFARFSSVASSKASSTGRGRQRQRLHRRHSTGGSSRPGDGVTVVEQSQ